MRRGGRVLARLVLRHVSTNSTQHLWDSQRRLVEFLAQAMAASRYGQSSDVES